MDGAVKTPSAQTLRRIALKAQGLTGRRRSGTGSDGLKRALERLSYIQIDTISVVARAHNHTAWLRTGKFSEDHFNTLIRHGDAFEYWYHAASYLPMRDYRYARIRMEVFRSDTFRYRRSGDTKLMRYVLDRIGEEGPLFARDFEAAPRKSKGWWDWKPAKRALEQLYMQGDLMIAARDGFAKQYELTERLLPSGIDTSTPRTEELASHLVDNALRAHGFATFNCMTRGRRGTEIKRAVTNEIELRLDRGELVTFELQTPERRERFFAPPKTIETHAKPPPVVRILSPFDNAVILRERCASIFDFDFTLECYLPEAKRKMGLLLDANPIWRPIRRPDGLQSRSQGRALQRQKPVHREIGRRWVSRRARNGNARLCGFHRLRGRRPLLLSDRT